VDQMQGAHWIREGGHHKKFPRGSQHIIAMVENSTVRRATKWPRKEETKAKKKEKILGKI
jgi:hypothetical protein